MANIELITGGISGAAVFAAASYWWFALYRRRIRQQQCFAALQIPCPVCGSFSGAPCRDKHGAPTFLHWARVMASVQSELHAIRWFVVSAEAGSLRASTPQYVWNRCHEVPKPIFGRNKNPSNVWFNYFHDTLSRSQLVRDVLEEPESKQIWSPVLLKDWKNIWNGRFSISASQCM